MKPGTFETIAALLHAGSGLVVQRDQAYLVENRLMPILRQHGLAGLDALADRLRPDGAGSLERQVIEAMTTNETLFFRDQRPFEHFRTRACPNCRPAALRRVA